MARETWDQVRTFALGFPKAIEEFPWGQQLAVSVKLTGSYGQAVTIGRAKPMTYSGLGKWGRLTVPLEGADVAELG